MSTSLRRAGCCGSVRQFNITVAFSHTFYEIISTVFLQSSELLRGPPDEEGQPFYVKVYFESQSMDQQRATTPLSGAVQPDRVFVAIPTCSDGPENSCPFEAFKDLALRSLDVNCVTTVPVGSFTH